MNRLNVEPEILDDKFVIVDLNNSLGRERMLSVSKSLVWKKVPKDNKLKTGSFISQS
jgi:hypothetical protein